jgi:hypothetical protein
MASGDKIGIDPRMYDIYRGLSIRGVMDALVELITNSFDAYRSVSTSGTVRIFTDPHLRKITVVDTAVGVSPEDFKSKILTAGSFTAAHSSRGMMGRGLKDITSISNKMVIRTCKEMSFSRTELLTDLSIQNTIIGSSPPPDLWSKLGISPEGASFFHVEFYVAPHIEFVSDESLFNRIRDNVAFRAEKLSDIIFNGTPVKFSLPSEDSKKLLSSFTLKIPGYPEGDPCKLVIYKYPVNLAAKCTEVHPTLGSDRKDYAYNGISVVSAGISYEMSDCSDGTWSSNGYSSYKFINGVLEVPHIKLLAHDLFENGASEKNPFLVFDPNRREGLNNRHPFVKTLKAEVGKWVRHVLRSISKSDNDVVNEGDFLKYVFDTLKDSIYNSIEMTDVKVYSWKSKEATQTLIEFEENIDTIEYIDDTISPGDKNSILPPPPPPPPIMEESNVKVRPKLDFQIVTDPDMDYVYRIKYEGENITVYLNSLDPAIQSYIHFKTEDGSALDAASILEAAHTEEGRPKTTATIENTEPAFVMMGMVVREAITEIHSRNILLTGSKKTTTDDLNSINEVKKEAYETFKSQVGALFRKIRVGSSALPQMTVQ